MQFIIFDGNSELCYRLSRKNSRAAPIEFLKVDLTKLNDKLMIKLILLKIRDSGLNNFSCTCNNMLLIMQ